MVLERLDGALSRADLVAATIERAVLRGELKPGERLVERELAATLGVSKTPVREALMVLARKGVLTSHPYRGTQVRSIDLEGARCIYEARLLLEPEAVRLATPSHNRETLRACEQALIDADLLVHNKDLAELSLTNRRFHSSLYAPGRNELLRSMLDDIQDQVAMVSVSTWRRRSTWEREAKEHRAIFEAVAGGHGDRAAELLHAHVERFLARVVENAPGEGI